ncbi:MAG: heme-copper oxidase subunit III [Elusimicrobia bacterium]|nr:heme-copper oxidase subunit III [Elusimicrobiota bacterium]
MSATATQALGPSKTTTGIPNGKLGVWLFLTSEVMLFATLFTSYIVLRMSAPSWPRGWEELNVPLAALNTVILITSSVTVVLAYAAACERDKAKFNAYLWITILLACAFLVVKSFEYGHKFTHHHFPSTSIFFAVYFTTTGLHGLHVILGIAYFAWLSYWAKDNWDHELFVGRVEYGGLYWHFVDIVWIFLFPALYLL